MTSLKQKWKKLQFELNARDLGAPSPEIRDIMEQEGWAFKLHHDFSFSASMMSPVSYAILIPISPEGKEVYPCAEGDKVYEQYKTARRKAAEKVFGIK